MPDISRTKMNGKDRRHTFRIFRHAMIGDFSVLRIVFLPHYIVSRVTVCGKCFKLDVHILS